MIFQILSKTVQWGPKVVNKSKEKSGQWGSSLVNTCAICRCLFCHLPRGDV